jgi:hypothetical protein
MLQMDQLMQVFDSVADQSESCALEAGSVPRNDTSTAMRELQVSVKHQEQIHQW